MSLLGKLARAAMGVPSGTTSSVCQAVPAERADRDRVWAAIRRRVAEAGLQPQLGLDALREQALAACREAGVDEANHRWAMVLVNSATWLPRLSAIPPTRRLLLLPQCLRHDECPAQIDKLGLLCEGCGRCVLGRLKAEAERLGYLVLISEGTAAVLALVQSGKIAGFVGASCLSTLEKVFPVMALVGLPAVAAPLLCGGCRNTSLDADWIEDFLRTGVVEDAA